MALHIASERVDRLARELAAITGERITTTVERALEERLARVRSRETDAERAERIEHARRIMERAQAACRAYGVQPMTKEEIDALWEPDASP
jgi:antitoxin VapB